MFHITKEEFAEIERKLVEGDWKTSLTDREIVYGIEVYHRATWLFDLMAGETAALHLTCQVRLDNLLELQRVRKLTEPTK